MNQIRLPMQIRVGANIYTAQFDTIPDGNSRFAETDNVNCKISIGTLTSAEKAPSSLLHELVHAICHDRNVDLKESEVNTLANGLTAVLQDMRLWPFSIYRPK